MRRLFRRIINIKNIETYVVVLSAIVGVCFLLNSKRYDNGYEQIDTNLGFTRSIACIVIGFVLSIIIVLFRGKEGKRTQVLKPFYDECAMYDIKTIDSEWKIKKVRLIAKRYNVFSQDIRLVYEECRKLFGERYMDNIYYESKRRLGSINQERKLCEQYYKDSKYNEWNKYSSLLGCDKRISILSSLMNSLPKGIKEENSASSIINATKSLQKKEMDWAVHGGIASGIAGPAAGLATALDIQSKNAQIRSYNKSVIDSMSPFILEAMDADRKNSKQNAEIRKKVTVISHEIERAKTLLVSDESSADCFSRITFENTNIDITDSYLVLTTHACIADSLKVFGNLVGVIDGTVRANIYEDGQIVGYINLVFPLYGLDTKDQLLKGRCKCTSNNTRNLKVVFEPKNLWIMEK